MDLGVQIGAQIGPYRIREKIGEGGMGVVYLAEQNEPVRRKVAFKIIKPGMDTNAMIARFEAERQALAVMSHPHIAGVYDAGSTPGGYPYFVMELVAGSRLRSTATRLGWGTRERLALFCDVCDAVQHAHQKGIIHRDIKPSNVMVTQISGRPVIKVIDFGLAKAASGQPLTEKSVYTGFMKLLGTPSYMSPEQAGLSGLDVDTRSDVYSLGVLLYEMLTGTTPIVRSKLESYDYETVCRVIREVETPKPSVRVSTLHNAQRSTVAEHRRVSPDGLRRLLRGDLDRVAMKALQKDRQQRYQTANEFSDDVRRFMADKPVKAVGPSPLYLARKYAQRHRVFIAVASGFTLLLVVATLVSSALAVRASRAEGRALAAMAQAGREANLARQEQTKAEQAREAVEASKRRLRRINYARELNLAANELDRGNLLAARELLNRQRPENRPAGQADVEDLRSWEWRYLWQLCLDNAYEVLLESKGREVTGLSVSHTGRYLAASCGDHIFVRDLIDDVPVADFPGSHAIFSPTETLLAYWAPNIDDKREGSFRLWDATSMQVVNNALLNTGAAFAVWVFRPTGAPWSSQLQIGICATQAN